MLQLAIRLISKMNYLYYFFYCAWHWGLHYAIFVIREEWRGARKYGIDTTGVHYLHHLIPRSKRQELSIYEPLNYWSAEQLMSFLTAADKKQAFLDMGCGKGRLLVVAAHAGFETLYGVDMAPELCEASQQTIATIQDRYPHTDFHIQQADAGNYSIPDEVGVICMFNPFGNPTMKRFIQQVQESLNRQPRSLAILYANPRCKEDWLEAGFKEVNSYSKFGFLEGVVLRK
jgi:SAM-dependent methyltransferase